MIYGDKQSWNNTPGYPTPEDVPLTTTCRSFIVPGSTAWEALLMGVMMTLLDESAWQQFDGGITPEEAAEAWAEIFYSGYDNTCGVQGNIPTPYWDEVTETDDEATPELQTWYGEVTNPTDPPDELDFVENAAIWAFTGILAVGAGAGAAMLFHTVAPRFVIAMRGESFVEVLRVILDGEEQARVTTTGDPDELIELPIVGDDSEHDLLIVRES
jgi:hypothetical protein